MERTKENKVLCPVTALWLWVLFAAAVMLIWCGALLWCVLSALSSMLH